MSTEYTVEIPPFDGRAYRHREISYTPADLRLKRPHVFILTDQPHRVVLEFANECDGGLTSFEDLTDRQIANSAFYVHFSLHEKALPFLRRIVACGGIFAPPPHFAKVPFVAVSANAIHSIENAARLLGHAPFGGMEIHSQICQAVELTQHLPGDFLEVGVFSGSSALTALSHMDRLGISRRCWLMDTFGGFNYETSRTSSDAIWGGTHLVEGLQERIQGLMSHTGQKFELVPGDICTDPLPAAIEKLALANIDVDMYDAELAALNKVAPLMVHRGVIIVEDATALPGLYGAYLALDEFMNSPIGRKFMAIRTTTQYFLVRVDP
jgi:Macrocin-O-methyltransferase (TylF).